MSDIPSSSVLEAPKQNGMSILLSPSLDLATPSRSSGKVEIPFHVPGVDGLRGIAALLVVVYHLFTCAGSPDLRSWHRINLLRPLHDGWAGVNLFLVLSGFCLFWPFARQPERKCRYVDFMRKRMRRILPAYYASLLIVPASYAAMSWAGLSVDGFHLPANWLDVVSHLLLLHSLLPKAIMSWNGVTWSLGLEWIWYLAFPLAVWLFRRIGAKWGLVTLAAITICYRVGLYLLFGPSAHFQDQMVPMTLRQFLFGRLLEFGLGMYVAALLAESYRSRDYYRATAKKWLGRKPVLLVCSLSVVTLIAAHLAVSTDAFLPNRDALYGIAFVLLLLAVIYPGRTLIQRVCSGWFLSRVGECSYSLYLLHLPIAFGVCGLLKAKGITGPQNFFLSLLALPFILLAAYLSYQVIEKPFLRLVKQR